MLDAAMQRKYSANPGEAFFTGRGMHVFANFDKTHNRRIMPVAKPSATRSTWYSSG